MNNRYTQNRHEGKLLSILYGGNMKEKWKESKYTNAEKINETQKQPERKRDKYYKEDRKK